MIGWLSGVVRLRDPVTGVVILDVSGVGYQVNVSLQTLATIPEPGQTCSVWIHSYVREDQLTLFGFASLEEKRLFLLLISVPQVGPKLAVGVLGGMPIVDLIRAIANEDRSRLEKTPGVGRKTAERIVLDLKEKVLPLLTPEPQASTGVRVPVSAAGLVDEARAVLVNLGWKGKQVEAALDKVAQEPGDPLGLDELVRRALAKLMER